MMVATIFQNEITGLEFQVQQLSAQIAAAQSRITALGEADTVAAGALQALQSAVQKISGLAPGAIAVLKAAALNLFQGGDDPIGGGGNEPTNPLPNLNGNGRSHEPEAVLARDILEVNSKELEKHLETQSDAVAPELNGQTSAIDPEKYWDTTAPDGSTWEFASPLQCLLEDAPVESQHYRAAEIPCSAPEVEQEPAYIELVKLSDVIAYQKKRDGEIVTAYIGIKSKSRAEQWGRWITAMKNIAAGFEIRQAKRVEGFKHEIKLWGISFDSIQKLLKLDLTAAPDEKTMDDWLALATPVPVPVIEVESIATVDPVESVLEVPRDLEIGKFEPGDVVSSLTVRNWSYTVLGVKADGLVEVERIGGNPPIRSILSPASVELVRRGGVVEVAAQEVTLHLERQALDSIQPPIQNSAPVDRYDVPAGVKLNRTPDDLLHKFEVWMEAEVRVMGRPQQQQKQIGTLTETMFGIEAIRPRASAGKTFARTLDAVKYLVSGSPYKLVPQVQKQAETVEPSDDATAPKDSELIEIGDWVEFLEDGQSYEIVSKKGSNFKLQSDAGSKFAGLEQVKLLFKRPADFTPF